MISEEAAWLALSGIRGIGPKALWSLAEYLIQENQSAAWLIENPEKLISRFKSKISADELAAALKSATDVTSADLNEDIIIVHPLHPSFPRRVADFSGHASLPAILYTHGNLNLLNASSAAIVGARNAGDRALEMAGQIACALAHAGINIVSGNAKGIDTAAHLAALDAGGTTTLVLSEGIKSFSVKGELSELLTADNALALSQFEPDAAWTAWFAMSRNKLVCALSSALIVIAAGPERGPDGKKSGTFDAGISALSLKIPTFVVSPSCFDDAVEGNETLISRDAIEYCPDQGIDVILEAINSECQKTTSELKTKTKSHAKKKSPNPDLFAEL